MYTDDYFIEMVCAKNMGSEDPRQENGSANYSQCRRKPAWIYGGFRLEWKFGCVCIKTMVSHWNPSKARTRIGRKYSSSFERRDSIVCECSYNAYLGHGSHLSYPSHSRFDALLVTYQQLAETSLFTLRLEARCRVMYYLDMATREVRFSRSSPLSLRYTYWRSYLQGNYFLEEESYEPDPYIMTLNANLVEIDDCVALSLPPTDERY